jgi:uncharacterized integral membrane protein (TIGR00697 family)
MSSTPYISVLKNKSTRLFVVLAGFFITNAIIAEFIGIKVFSLEKTIGLAPFNWNIFGQSGSLMLSAGVLIWPVVFIMTDIINEYYGKRGVKMLSYMTAGLISFSFLIIFMSIKLTPADFWISDFEHKGIQDMQLAFSAVFGQGLYIIIGSLVAFLLGQMVDAYIFHKVRISTGENSIWIRATVSTIVSQLLDSFLVLYIAFVIGNNWTISLWLAVGTVNFSYKVFMAILMLPLLYLVHFAIERYLGKEIASAMKAEARYVE